MSYRPCEIRGCPNTTRRASGRCHDHRYADRDAREPVSPPPEATERASAAERALREAFGPQVTATTFVSGAVDVEVRTGSGVAIVQATSGDDGWGVSIDPDDGPTGHDHVVGSITEVVDLLRARWPTT